MCIRMCMLYVLVAVLWLLPSLAGAAAATAQTGQAAAVQTSGSGQGTATVARGSGAAGRESWLLDGAGGARAGGFGNAD